MALHLVKPPQAGVFDLLWRHFADPELWGEFLSRHPALVEHFASTTYDPASFGWFLQTMWARYVDLRATGTCDRAPLAPQPHRDGTHAPLPLPAPDDESEPGTTNR